MRVATIDIGTNTTLLLIAEQAADGTVTALLERAEITRLGRGIGRDGELQTENVERTLEVLTSYAKQAEDFGAEVFAIGTEGLRRAPDSERFLVPAAQILGRPVEVITGEREAALTFLAATRSFPTDTRGVCTVIDIGGGSTEIIVADGGEISFRQSLPLGSVRLTERFITTDPPRAPDVEALEAHIAAALAPVPFPKVGTFIGAAGTVTTLAAMAQNLRSYDPTKVHGYRLSHQALRLQVQRLAAATQSERESFPGLDPKRADVIFAGASLLQGLVATAGVAEVLVSDRGIRWGLLFDKLEQPART